MSKRLSEMFKELDKPKPTPVKKVVSKPIVKPKIVEGNLYQKIKDKFTGSSDFDRALVGAIDDVLPGLIDRKALRKSKDVMIPSINKGIKMMREKLDIVEQLKTKYTPVYKDVVNELNQVLAERKEKLNL